MIFSSSESACTHSLTVRTHIPENIAALPGTGWITHSGYDAPIGKAYFFFLFLALVLRFTAPFLARFFSFRACFSTMISSQLESDCTQ
jgi:hypothetical protein